MDKEELRKMFSRSDWDEETILKADEIISRFYLKYCTKEDFANFNATDIYDNLDALDFIKNKTT